MSAGDDMRDLRGLVMAVDARIDALADDAAHLRAEAIPDIQAANRANRDAIDEQRESARVAAQCDAIERRRLADEVARLRREADALRIDLAHWMARATTTDERLAEAERQLVIHGGEIESIHDAMPDD